MKEKTKELADSVGAVYPVLFMGRHDGVLFTETELETFVELVAAAEPVAYLCENGVGHKYFRWKKPSDIYKPIGLYTTPPQRPWVGLTDEEMSDIVADMDVDFGDLLWKVVCLTKIIQATIKERNT